MSVSNRVVLSIVAAACACMAASVSAQYPSKPIRVVVPLVAGGTPDLVSRTLGQKLSENMAIPVVVDNRPGASGVIAAEFVMKSPADGYTLFTVDTGHVAINPVLLPNLPYDTLRDFTPVSQVVGQEFFLFAHSDLPVRTVQELVALSKSRPGGLSYGSTGNGGPHHLGMERLKLATGAKLTHVPYKGVGQMVPALVAKDIDVMFSSTMPVLPHLKAGKVKALALGAPHRSPLLPDVPTFAEAGVPGGLDVNVAVGFVVRSGTSREIVQRLQAEIVKALDDPALKQRYVDLGFRIIGNTSEEFAESIRTDLSRFGKLVKEANIRAE